MVRLAVNVPDWLKKELEAMSDQTNLPMNALAIMALGWLTNNYNKDPNCIFTNILPNGPIGSLTSNITKSYDLALDELDSDPSMKEAADDLRNYESDDGTRRGWDSYTRYGEFSDKFPNASRKLWS